MGARCNRRRGICGAGDAPRVARTRRRLGARRVDRAKPDVRVPPRGDHAGVRPSRSAQLRPTGDRGGSRCHLPSCPTSIGESTKPLCASLLRGATELRRSRPGGRGPSERRHRWCAHVSRPARPAAVRWRVAGRHRWCGAATRVCASRGTVVSRAAVRVGASLCRHDRRPRSERQHHDRQSRDGPAGSVRRQTLSRRGGPARAAWCVVRRPCPGLPGSTGSARARLGRLDRS